MVLKGFLNVKHMMFIIQEKKTFDGLSENKIKTSCIRIRNPKKKDKLQEKNLSKKDILKYSIRQKKIIILKKKK